MRGNYGAVHTCVAHVPVEDAEISAVAKCARPLVNEEWQLAEAYLDVEAKVNSRLALLSPNKGRYFPRYLGDTVQDGERWLVWQRVGGPGNAISLADYSGDLPRLEREQGLTGRDVQTQLLEAVDALHSLGFVHRDIKPENVLINGGTLQLIDMGSCAQLEGCVLSDTWMNTCVGYDRTQSPCTPLFAPPEQFVDPLYPWSFDVYSIGITVLKLCWPMLGPDEEALNDFCSEFTCARIP